jgi:uncharacterized damage-inducible protein DinB
MAVMTDPRYPIGPFTPPGSLSPAARVEAIAAIGRVPERLCDVVRGLSDVQLDTPYRQGGWTLRQVVHHLADSHVNAYVRCKLTVSEDNPTIQSYDEATWAEFVDARGAIGGSLLLTQALHERWVGWLRSLPAEAFGRSCTHTQRGNLSLDDLVAMYAWHGPHHVAQIATLRRAKGW